MNERLPVSQVADEVVRPGSNGEASLLPEERKVLGLPPLAASPSKARS